MLKQSIQQVDRVRSFYFQAPLFLSITSTQNIWVQRQRSISTSVLMGNSGSSQKAESFVPEVPEGIDPDEFLKLIERLDNQIIVELTGKAKCVYDKMVDADNNINWILENFEDSDEPSEFNLKFVMSTTLLNTTNASNTKSGNTFMIEINANTLSSKTALGLARTIIHEGIHARLREFLHRKEGTLSKEDFPGVYE